MASPGRRSLAAVCGCGVLFPSRFVARAVLAGVRLSSSVPSASPVVAAVRLALARSLRLGPPLAGRNHTTAQPNQPLHPWRRGKRNQQPRTTNAHAENQAPLGLDVRPNKDEVSSPKARPKISSRSAASPSGAVACALNRTTKRATGLRPLFVERWSPRADADAHARRRPTVGPSRLSGVQVAFQPIL